MKWIFERVSGNGEAVMTPIGSVPAEGALDISGLNLSSESLQDLLSVNKNEWKDEVTELRDYFKLYGDRLPYGIRDELNNLEQRLN